MDLLIPLNNFLIFSIALHFSLWYRRCGRILTLGLCSNKLNWLWVQSDSRIWDYGSLRCSKKNKVKNFPYCSCVYFFFFREMISIKTTHQKWILKDPKFVVTNLRFHHLFCQHKCITLKHWQIHLKINVSLPVIVSCGK